MSTLYTISVKPPQVLYHGSSRLYTIECYIQKKNHLLDRYLRDLQNSHNPHDLRNLHNSHPTQQQRRPTTLEKATLQSGLHRYQTLLNSDFNLKAVPKQVFLLRVLETMYEFPNSIFIVSQEVESLLTHNTDAEPAYLEYPEEYQKLLDWLRLVETYPSLQEVEDQHLLDIGFFSAMRSPVQFFANRETAILYAKTTEALYQYEPQRELHFLDISHLETIKNLMKPEGPFFDTTTYSFKILTHYTESSDLDKFRFSQATILFNFLLRKGKPLYKDISTKYTSRYETTDVYHFDYFSGFSFDEKPEVLNARLQGRSWRSFLTNVVEYMYNNFRENWIFYSTHIAQQPSTDSIVDSIIEQFPTSNALQEEDFYSVFNGYEDYLQTKIYEDEKAELVTAFIPFIDSLDKYYTIVSESARERILKEFLENVNKPLTYNRRLFTKDWLGHFKIDIASPRGLWALLQFPLLTGLGSERLTFFDVDSIVIATILPLIAESHLDGWYCKEPLEYMVFRPEDRGIMKRLGSDFSDSQAFEAENCDYDEGFD